jgi:hypothetical protein
MMPRRSVTPTLMTPMHVTTPAALKNGTYFVCFTDYFCLWAQ